MPKYNEGALFAALGFLLLFLIGALIGGHLGAKKDTKKRQYYRSAWVDSESNLISYEYTGDIFLQIPLEALRGTLVLSGNKFAINYSGVMITLQMGYQKEFDRFKQYIEKYVL